MSRRHPEPATRCRKTMEGTKTPSSRRPAILMGILLVLTGGYAFQSQFDPATFPVNVRSAQPQLTRLPGTNSVSKLQVKKDAKGIWVADFDYFYTGGAVLSVFEIQLEPRASVLNPNSGVPNEGLAMGVAQKGAHHLSIAVPYPFAEATTRQVSIRMQDSSGSKPVLAAQTVDQVIDWPSPGIWQRDQQIAQSTPEENFQRAVRLIDSQAEAQIAEARAILERLIERDSRFDQAYVELARVAMKSNWGPEGLHQAETLLNTALQIRPDSVNARILLGYVYSNQKRFDQAQQLFAEAARTNTPNTWLWTNWGELLLMRHQNEQAIAKFREAISRPPTHDSYDLARVNAYIHLLTLLGERKDLDGMEALFKQRMADFGTKGCYTSEYARFMLQVRGNTQSAIDIARHGLDENCEGTPARQVLGLAQYVKWGTTSGPEQIESLNQARIYLPAGPMPLYLLAGSDRTSSTVKKLLAAGEHIDEEDNERQTALSYALRAGDLGAAKRLLTLRANPNTLVGYEEIPLALVPVMQGNVEAVPLLRENGVDYSKLRFRGATAFDFAKQTGNEALLRALGHSETTL
jgi:tetratricopeptide (TPR) repeat protein